MVDIHFHTDDHQQQLWPVCGCNSVLCSPPGRFHDESTTHWLSNCNVYGVSARTTLNYVCPLSCPVAVLCGCVNMMSRECGFRCAVRPIKMWDIARRSKTERRGGRERQEGKQEELGEEEEELNSILLFILWLSYNILFGKRSLIWEWEWIVVSTWNRWTVVEYVFSLSVALNLSDYSTLFQAIDLGFR